MSDSDVSAFVGGVLAGAKISSVDDLESCIKDINPIGISHIDAAANDFDDGDVQKYRNGINELGQFFSAVATDMENCGKLSSDDVTILKNIADAFLNPKNP